MSESDVLNTLAVLSEAYGTEPSSVTGYVWALEEYPPDVLIQAARQAVKLHAWYPKPAELRVICDEVKMAKKHDDHESERESRNLRDQAYYMHDLYREGQISEEQFTSDKAVKWAHKQFGMFSSLFGKK
jgi:hypothetical protein